MNSCLHFYALYEVTSGVFMTYSDSAHTYIAWVYVLRIIPEFRILSFDDKLYAQSLKNKYYVHKGVGNE